MICEGLYILYIKYTLLIHVSGECSDNRATEGETSDSFEHLNYVADALNRLFDILFSCEGLVVKGVSISVERRKTLRSFMPPTEGQPPAPKEVIAVEVSVRLELQEPLDLDSLADVAESVKEAGLKASFSSGGLNVKINLADIPLA
jgi:hypothetical protein